MPLDSKNNFDLVRFWLAMTVCLVHAAQLSGEPALRLLELALSSELAVQGFFAVSGFLIVMSYERSSSLRAYFEKRARRLVPAYVVVVVLSATLLKAFSEAQYFYFTQAWWSYLAANLSYLNFLHPTLPGVFQHNGNPAVNGALWTLKIEIGFYLMVPCFVWAVRRYGAVAVILAGYLLSAGYSASVSGSLQHQLPGEWRFFMVGAACHYGWSRLLRHRFALIASACAILAAKHVLPLPLIEPVAVGLLVICAGSFFYLGDFGRYGDFSYGIYILHFPVIQTLVSLGAFQSQPWPALFTAVTLTLSGAVLMWHLVECRFLHRTGGHLHGKTSGAGA